MTQLVPITGLATCLLLTTVASAAPTSGDPADDCRKAQKQNKKCRLLVFDEEEVRGARPLGLGEPISVPSASKWGSLLRLRTDFRDRIIATARDI